jgi:hypothetical protein
MGVPQLGGTPATLYPGSKFKVKYVICGIIFGEAILMDTFDTR